ncbi:unnamed protein product [Closterium sp. Naga37s-1]|nr:unnamed protein product [Closterium sp. Naga37s-1]
MPPRIRGPLSPPLFHKVLLSHLEFSSSHLLHASPAACLTCCMTHLLHASPAACLTCCMCPRQCKWLAESAFSLASFCSPRFSPLPFPLPIILSRLLPPTRLSSIWLPSTLSPPLLPLPCTPNPPLMSPFYHPPCPPSHPPLTQPNPPPSRTPPSPLPALCSPNPAAATARLSCSTHPPRLSRQHHQSASPSPPHTHALPRRCVHPLILRVSPRSPTGGPPCALYCARPLTPGARSFPFPLSHTSPPLRLPVLPSSALQLPRMLSLPRLLLSLAPLPPNPSHSRPHSHFSPPLPVPPLPAPPFLPPPRDRPPVIASFSTSANFHGGGGRGALAAGMAETIQRTLSPNLFPALSPLSTCPFSPPPLSCSPFFGKTRIISASIPLFPSPPCASPSSSVRPPVDAALICVSPAAGAQYRFSPTLAEAAIAAADPPLAPATVP